GGTGVGRTSTSLQTMSPALRRDVLPEALSVVVPTVVRFMEIARSSEVTRSWATPTRTHAGAVVALRTKNVPSRVVPGTITSSVGKTGRSSTADQLVPSRLSSMPAAACAGGAVG